MDIVKNIGIVAHDAKKPEMLAWAERHAQTLSRHNMVCTGTTGGLISAMFAEKFPRLSVNVTRLKSGPLGGDQQVGAMIAEGRIDVLIFLTDPMTTQPHDVDVKALVRLCTVYNIVLACTLSTADFIIASPLFSQTYAIRTADYSEYITRQPLA